MPARNWFAITNLSADTAEVKIYDDIGAYGVSAKQFCDEFNAIKAAKIDLRINSYGGEVFDAAAICTAIGEHSAEVTAHVDGIAASAASVVAAACDSVQIGQSAFLMIHNPLTMAYGNAAEMRKQADVLDKLADSIAGVYARKTGKPMPEVRKAMDDETWFDAAEAKAWGLADTIKENDDDDDDDDDQGNDRAGNRMLNSLAPLLITKFRNVPPAIKAMACGRKEAGSRKPVASQEKPIMLNIISRDGKNFVTIDGKEFEVSSGTLLTNAASKPGNSDEEVAAAVKAAADKAAADATKAERDYRAMFTTVVASANLSGESAAKFEKDFYGRAEGDLKFLASHAIGQRAKPVGEGSGNPEGQTEPEKARAEIRDYCAKRLADPKETTLRRTFRAGSSNPADAGFKAALEKFIAVETRSRADWAEKSNGAASEEQPNDRISALMKNKSVYA